MCEVIFSYNQSNIIIQCELKDKLNDIIQKYINKTGIELNTIYFLYSGQKINDNLSLGQLINK